MGHGGTAIDELMIDHREVEEFFGRIDALPPGDERRKTLADQVTIELVRHSVAEEAYLYPAVREHVAGGDDIADREIADHARAEQLMKDLEGLRADERAFDLTMDKFMQEIRAHIADEEEHLFPRLRDACSHDELLRLGDKVRTAKKTAPTRPHPSSPHEPPANKLLAPGLGLVDRARDLLTGRGKE
jgi:hemerythrin superfamily protein